MIRPMPRLPPPIFQVGHLERLPLDGHKDPNFDSARGPVIW
jgi:hypothetical protein